MLVGQEHVRRYIETDGAEGHDWLWATVLILTTIGRHTRKSRSTPLTYGRRGDDYLVVASKGGSPTHPSWYLNLLEQPDVSVQVHGDHFAASARTATAQEKPELWRLMTSKWPAYDQYQHNTTREIPVLVVERAE